MKIKTLKLKDIPVYEHLDISLKCTYAQRLKWLEEANKFVRMLQKRKGYPNLSRKSKNML